MSATEPLLRTCDGCGEGPVPVRIDEPSEAYICAECDALHQRGLDAAAGVIWRIGISYLPLGEADKLAAAGVDAYLAAVAADTPKEHE